MRRIFIGVLLTAVVTGSCSLESRAKAAVPPINAAGASGLAVAWSTVLDGVPAAIVADAQGEVVTVDQEQLVALDTEGRVQWSVPLIGASLGSLRLTVDQVIVPLSFWDGSSGCAGIDRETGKTRWAWRVRGSGGAVVALAGRLAICMTRDGVSVGINLESGRAAWTWRFSTHTPRSSIEIPDNTVIAVDEAMGLFAFTVRVGDEWLLTWRHVKSGRDGRYFRLGSGSTPTAPVFVDGRAIALAVGLDPSLLFMIDVHTLRETWIALPGAEEFRPGGAPLVAHGVVVVAACTGEVTAVDLETRRVRWTARMGDPMLEARPVLIGDTVLLTAGMLPVYGFRLTTGAPVRLPRASGALIVTPAGVEPAAIVLAGSGLGSSWIRRWEVVS